VLESLREALRVLERHARVLELVSDHEPVGIERLSELSGMEWHKVRYSLRTLEREGIIRPSPRGAVLTEEAPERVRDLVRELRDLRERFDALLRRYELLLDRMDRTQGEG